MGGSSGGGGSSGTVDYPAYMKTVHNDWLDNTGVDKIGQSITDCMNHAMLSNPFTGLAAYNPTTAISVMTAGLGDLEVLVDALNYNTDYASIIAAAATQIDANINPASRVAAVVSAHSAILDNEYNGKIIPTFEAGMRDINMVMSSSFIIGRAQLLTDRTEKINKFTADLEMQIESNRGDLIKQAVSEMLRILIQKIEYTRAWAALTIDARRLQIAAYGDQLTEDKVIAVGKEKWNLEMWQYGANLLAAISGGTATSSKVEGNQVARVVGGALSGASAGALLGAAIGGSDSSGGAIGALLGAGLGAALS